MTSVPSHAANTRVVSFPAAAHRGLEPSPSAGAPAYTFTAGEQAILCRWYSAMRYAFPEVEAFLVVSHAGRYSMVGLRHINRCSAPAGMLFKHIEPDTPMFVWVTGEDITIGPVPRLTDITDRHIAAAACPTDESQWLDPCGWQSVLDERTVYNTRE